METSTELTVSNSPYSLWFGNLGPFTPLPTIINVRSEIYLVVRGPASRHELCGYVRRLRWKETPGNRSGGMERRRKNALFTRGRLARGIPSYIYVPGRCELIAGIREVCNHSHY